MSYFHRTILPVGSVWQSQIDDRLDVHNHLTSGQQRYHKREQADICRRNPSFQGMLSLGEDACYFYSRAIVVCATPYVRAITDNGSPASRRFKASCR
jgi:hypothetical protein